MVQNLVPIIIHYEDYIMNAAYLNTYFYNNQFLTAIAGGEDYVVVEETTETLKSGPTAAQLRMPTAAGWNSAGGIRRVCAVPADKIDQVEQPYLQLKTVVGDGDEFYYEQWNEVHEVVDSRGDSKVLNHAMSYYDARDLPSNVFDSKACKFNVVNLKRWMEAAKFCRDNHSKGWDDSTLMRRAAAEGIDLDYVMAQ